jgi:hypothetical protein
MKLLEHHYLDIIKIHNVVAAHSVQYPFCDQSNFEKFVADSRFTDDGNLRYQNAIEIFQLDTGKEKAGMIDRSSFLRVLLLIIKKKY